MVRPTQWLIDLQSRTHKNFSVLGLFATQDIPYKNPRTNRRTPLTPYGGRLICTDSDQTHEKSSHYISVGCRGFVLDGFRSPRVGFGLGAFVNHSAQCSNAVFVKDAVRKTCYLQASRSIRAGEEIFVHYGRNYWHRFKDDES